MSDRQKEFHAATVEQALDKASTTLSIDRDELSFEVLDRGSTGFLGIGARDARILVELQGETGVPAQDKELPPGSHEEKQQGLPVEEPDGRQQTAEDPHIRTVEAPDDLVIAVDGFVTTLVDLMGFDATVAAYDAGDTIIVDVAMKETGLFIGQKGETIEAVQYLVNVVVYKDHPFVKRIVVDSEGYRQRRVEAIQGMAHRVARRAQREKRPLSLPPMSAAERRVVHLFLKENPDVTTSSSGEGENRKVIVSPA